MDSLPQDYSTTNHTESLYQQLVQEKETFDRLALRTWQQKTICETNGASVLAIRREAQYGAFYLAARALEAIVQEHFCITKEGIALLQPEEVAYEAG